MPASVMPSNEETSTRREIINILRTAGPLTVGELGDRLGITHVAVRRHLTSLERDGLVSSVQERLPMGRPTRVYSLTESADELFPKKYGALTLEILDFLADDNGDLVEQFFAARGKSFVGKYGPEVTKGESLEDRVARLSEIQQANGYLSDWAKAEGDTFVLKEFNCPVHQVSRKYPHACHHELEFFKTVLGTESVERVECIAKGGTCCRYVIAPTENA
ncbi:MAG TPA: metalloregulator ArsR/SmtB family transcription factor [Symbiobacteriaceae bacterium]|jgi:predicted ArsR family transcriptional regulator|nr:metalloregulator ArsR/SmtB family transcription factor [Symbiobacteriaceae bacterium]